MSERDRCQNEGCHATFAEDGTCHVCAVGMGDPKAAWDAWVASRPGQTMGVIARHQLAPNKYYRLAETGSDYYQLNSVNKDGSISLLRYDALTHRPMWIVFGIDPSELIFWKESPWERFRR